MIIIGQKNFSTKVKTNKFQERLARREQEDHRTKELFDYIEKIK
jgi:hypothetical protein